MDSLSKGQVEECRKLFAVLDVSNEDKLTSKQLGAALRGLRISISEQSLQSLTATVDRDYNGAVDFPEFCGVYAKHLADVLNLEKLLSTLAAFDTNSTGTVNPEELKQILTSEGEPLTESEIDEVFRDAGLSGNSVQYKNLATLLLS